MRLPIRHGCRYWADSLTDRAERSFRRRLIHSVAVELLLTMGHLNNAMISRIVGGLA
jgi:hypothetical protein